MDSLKFHEPLNTAVITNKNIINHSGWIGHVSHDKKDGGWQFLELKNKQSPEDAAVISLEQIIQIDPSVTELVDLPLGWHAWRETKDSPWKRGKAK